MTEPSSEPPPIADGLEHRLDPRVIPLQRITGGLTVAAFALASLGVLAIVLTVGDDIPTAVRRLLPVAWLVLVATASVVAYRWPSHHYPYTSYLVDEHGIEIRKGVYWRAVINVPRSRVQHIDVSQGPLDRRYGLGTLVLYTAGTDHARVALDGLEHGLALGIREHLLPSGADDAV